MFDETRRSAVSASMRPASDYSGAVDYSSLEEQAALVDLLRSRPGGMNWIQITSEVMAHGGPMAFAEALSGESLFITDERRSELDQALADVESWAASGLTMLTIVDDRYPGSVRDIHQAPPFLFADGRLLHDDVGVSVVGSRQVSAHGTKMATAVAGALADMSVTVISGLAKGVDTAAHRAAIEAGGRPVGLIATGIDRVYPAENHDLHRQVAKHGLLLSQFWPGASPQKHNFLMRNATMSGYGVATVVIEAGEHSGARAQARMAFEHGRPVILTDLVVDRTEWARGMLGQPGVFVASSTQDVVDVVRSLVDELNKIDSALGALIAS